MLTAKHGQNCREVPVQTKQRPLNEQSIVPLFVCEIRGEFWALHLIVCLIS